MSRVLQLQALTPSVASLEDGNLFGSSISTVCPTGAGEDTSPFAME